jgi:hypothetical protein
LGVGLVGWISTWFVQCNANRISLEHYECTFFLPKSLFSLQSKEGSTSRLKKKKTHTMDLDYSDAGSQTQSSRYNKNHKGNCRQVCTMHHIRLPTGFGRWISSVGKFSKGFRLRSRLITIGRKCNPDPSFFFFFKKDPGTGSI